ncbi:hypothetical protein C8J36_11134 [Rhizobium sp. PP-F2F-G48]|uniref:hypothetical protein n=1 Tax=Rhizobium sp. PP-F2F-G48 TaxID=2135651 RepID=UPI001045401F|nr:hypothetical protein [Rhizobium sp. PP-F2F-G48]TCM50702.1 hypothetical protein C8J36_11134 [Rhizobium sp. PP-F2F-G48]
MAEPSTSTSTRTPNAEDIAFWPDGAWARLGDVSRGDFDWKSDDYEVVLMENTLRLRELTVFDELS